MYVVSLRRRCSPQQGSLVQKGRVGLNRALASLMDLSSVHVSVSVSSNPFTSVLHASPQLPISVCNPIMPSHPLLPPAENSLTTRSQAQFLMASPTWSICSTCEQRATCHVFHAGHVLSSSLTSFSMFGWISRTSLHGGQISDALQNAVPSTVLQLIETRGCVFGV